MGMKRVPMGIIRGTYIDVYGNTQEHTTAVGSQYESRIGHINELVARGMGKRVTITSDERTHRQD